MSSVFVSFFFFWLKNKNKCIGCSLVSTRCARIFLWWSLSCHKNSLFRKIKKLLFLSKVTFYLSLHNTYFITPNRVTSLRGPASTRHSARATLIFSKICCSSGEPQATLCLIWPAWDLNLIPPALKKNASKLTLYLPNHANYFIPNFCLLDFFE